MTATRLTEDVRRFLVDCIGSVVQLEALLLLHRDQRAWTAEELSRELRIEREGAAVQLDELARAALVSRREGTPPSYSFNARDARLAELVARLAQVYEEHRVSVISLIYSKPADTIRVFADAFRLRRDEDDG